MDITKINISTKYEHNQILIATKDMLSNDFLKSSCSHFCMMIKLSFLPSFLALYRNIKKCVIQVVLHHIPLGLDEVLRTYIAETSSE